MKTFTNSPEGPPKLTTEDLRTQWEATLAHPRRRYSKAAQALFVLLDVVYGRPRSLSKFKVLEVIARVPYQAWEHVAYVAVTHRYSRPTFARRIFERVSESRDEDVPSPVELRWRPLLVRRLLPHHRIGVRQLLSPELPGRHEGRAGEGSR